MSDINLYTLSNKIRTVLLTAIDKEILISSKNNHLLLNSQTQEQLIKKFVTYRDFAIESEESFEGVKTNEDNEVFYDLRCNYSNNKLSFLCKSSRSNCCLFPQNFTNKSFSPQKNNGSPILKKSTNPKISENNICKLKNDSEKRIIPKMKSSFSCKEVDLKNLVPLSNDNRGNFMKKFSADLNNLCDDNKNNDSSKLINYCYNLKKPNDEIISEISDDDTPTNQENKKNHLFTHRIKYDHKNIPKKKLKKTINKKKSESKNSNSNDDSPLKSPFKNKIINFPSEIKFYPDDTEKSNQNEKLKIQRKGRKFSIIETKENDNFYWKDILQLHHNNSSKSSEKKSKGKKIEQKRKSVCIPMISKKPTNKKFLRLQTIDNNNLILNHKEKKEKKEKNDAYFAVETVSNTKMHKKFFKRSKTLFKNNDEFEQNEMFCFGKKNLKNNVNKFNESTKNERKNIEIVNTNYNNYKEVHKNDPIKIKPNLRKISSNHKIDWDKTKN